MADAGDLQILAESYLAACVEALDSIPDFSLGLGGSPGRSFVTHGNPVMDCCDQLVVSINTVSESLTGQVPGATSKSFKTGWTNLVTLIATISRCIPVPDAHGNPPPVAEMQAAAAQLNADNWALWNHVHHLVAAGMLFESCGEVFFDGIRALQPSGGCAGWVMQVRVSLNGYSENLVIT
jgi:hypothetical protein